MSFELYSSEVLSNAPRCRFFLDAPRKGREFSEREGGRTQEEEEERHTKKSASKREINRRWTQKGRAGMDLCIPLGVKR